MIQGRCSPTTRTVSRILVILFAALGSLSVTIKAQAGERKFLVILANSPKQFPGDGQPPGGLTNPAIINSQYFDKVPNNGVDSFAEYWAEISYGDVTIAGLTTDWISLPWPILPQDASPADFVTLDPQDGFLFNYGKSERFDNSRAMIVTEAPDPRRDPTDPDPRVIGSLDVSRGVTNAGNFVWMPGHRYLDMDNDGRWDGLDEATNQMDWDGDGKPDLRGPWVDLDGNGEPNNPAGCVYLPDSDNDGNPDCCPNGPGKSGCLGLAVDPEACAPTRWTPEGTAEWSDCNGNVIPDPCDISCTSAACTQTGFDVTQRDGQGNLVCGRSSDQRPFQEGAGTCSSPTVDGIPDECQFTNFQSFCIASQADPMSPCVGRPLCEVSVRASSQRCEYDDANENGRLDIVEPFESFLRIGNHRAVGDDGVNPDFGMVLDPNDPLPSRRQQAVDYIRFNYPGDADRVIARSTPNTLFGAHDPLGKAPSDCQCPSGTGMVPCTNVTLPNPDGGTTVLVRACPAGEFLPFASPDSWIEIGNNKVTAERDPLPQTTPEPTWYAQAWTDRYFGTCQNPGHITNPSEPETIDCNDQIDQTNPTPLWTSVPRWSSTIRSIVPVSNSTRRAFAANRGGLNGDGTGWVPAENRDIVFTTGSFEAALDRRIMPEEQAGIGQPLALFDGWVEYDDLPSSKYHMGGDQRLGEVTSPISDNFWGQDLAPLPAGDGNIQAGGPYAIRTHGDLNTDAGNVLNMELLTWRTSPPFNNGNAWADRNGFHPYAGGPNGEGLGFRDYNLDGLLDQGEVRPAGSENYVVDANINFEPKIRGTSTDYPFNRQRLLEDCIEILDQLFDFDTVLDPTFLRGGPVPIQYDDPAVPGVDVIQGEGVLSGIVLLPPGAHVDRDFLRAPSYFPIHNQDSPSTETVLPRVPDGATLDTRYCTISKIACLSVADCPLNNESCRVPERIHWNLWVHDLVIKLDDNRDFAGSFQTGYSAHEYLHTWEGFPDLYDYDIYKPQPQPPINTPIGRWDIMANGSLVHPSPILKEKPGTRWIDTVDLTSLLTPGTPRTITLPRSEFVRDDSHFFFENEDALGERYYFWSVGSGFNQLMPGAGMLVMHTNVGGNPDALPSGQQNATAFEYLIVQADGLHQLEAGVSPFGDDGDPWPGSTGNTTFTCNTNPSSTWYGLGSCTGLSVLDVEADGQGSAQTTFLWQPTSVPSLSFTDPPGGTSVPDPSGTIVRYQVRFSSTDSFAGTTIRLHYTEDATDVSVQLGAGGTCNRNDPSSNCIGELKKPTPGTGDYSIDWQIRNGFKTVPDGRYFIFAELVPGVGTNNRTERSASRTRAGRNNTGNGSMTVLSVNTAGRKARSESWTAECIKADGTEWKVTSSLTQPPPADSAPNQDPYPHAITGQVYNSLNGAVSFRITAGSVPFTLGDTFSFVTTGLTATSEPVTIKNGRITEGPTAVITASPLAGNSPLTVNFDARGSSDPTGQSLAFNWDFGDGSANASGAQVTHTFVGSRTFSVTLRATNPNNGRFDETTVDIALTNNSPKAVMTADPTSGSLPLNVSFSAAGSTDTETPANQLVYRWDFGDGSGASTGRPGELTSVTHLYSVANTYDATLTVTDQGGKSDTVTVSIIAGNNRPVPVISNTSTQGTSPLTVSFNGLNSFDPDNETFTITWKWGDGKPDETYPRTGSAGRTDGLVMHTYTLPTGQTNATFKTTAVLTDARGATATWPGVTVTVIEPTAGGSTPRALFSLDPDPPFANESFTADGSTSFDRPSGGLPASFLWEWGDGTANGTGVKATHTYAQPGTYELKLTVSDAENPPNRNSSTRTLVVSLRPDVPPEQTNRPPSAVIRVSPNQGPVDSEFEFDAGSSSDPDGDDLTYRWSFGDGASGSGRVVRHAYDDPGNYVARLTVRDSQGAASDATALVVVTDVSGNRNPVAFIGSGQRIGTAPLTLTLNGQNSFDPDGDSLTYQWEFRLGETLIGTLFGGVVNRTFDAVGIYTVILQVDDGRGGVSRTDPITITVTEAPIIDDEDTPRPDPDEPAPLPVRPGGACGLGMVPAFLGALLGLMWSLGSRGRRTDR